LRGFLDSRLDETIAPVALDRWLEALYSPRPSPVQRRFEFLALHPGAHARALSAKIEGADDLTSCQFSCNKKTRSSMPRASGRSRSAGEDLQKDEFPLKDTLCYSSLPEEPRTVYGSEQRCLQITSRILSSIIVFTIFFASFSPRISASAKWSACSSFIWPGSGGSFLSTTASTTTGPLC